MIGEKVLNLGGGAERAFEAGIVQRANDPVNSPQASTPIDFAAQFGNIYREKLVVKAQPEKDDKTLYGNEYVWKRNGHDDYVHALLYAMVGLQRFSGQQAKIFGQRNSFPKAMVVGNDGVKVRSIPAPETTQVVMLNWPNEK